MSLRFFLTLSLFALSIATSHSSESCIHTEDALRCVEYVRNYDADTITVNVPGLHPLIGQKISIRVNGIDTPEMRTKNLCEKEKARVAKKWVERSLKKAKRIDLLNIDRGKYFRIVADVYIDGVNLTDVLLDKGMGYPYLGATKKKVNWCLSFKQLATQFKNLKEESGRDTASKKSTE